MSNERIDCGTRQNNRSEEHWGKHQVTDVLNWLYLKFKVHREFVDTKWLYRWNVILHTFVLCCVDCWRLWAAPWPNRRWASHLPKHFRRLLPSHMIMLNVKMPDRWRATGEHWTIQWIYLSFLCLMRGTWTEVRALGDCVQVFFLYFSFLVNFLIWWMARFLLTFNIRNYLARIKLFKIVICLAAIIKDGVMGQGYLSNKQSIQFFSLGDELFLYFLIEASDSNWNIIICC